MEKTVLIISPYFPPSNAADMQRIRMSLPHFKTFGWNAEVVCVHEKFSEMVMDDLLLRSIPGNTVIHKVNALPRAWTSVLGLGSLALRSLFFYKKKVDQLLSEKKYDLVYFSTTQFPVCILGSSWNKQFGVPYIIDMQDPWHSDYYKNKPRAQKPKKYWFSYRLNKFLEPIAMKRAGGIISVSPKYIESLQIRYPVLKNVPSAVIPFGASALDVQIAKEAGVLPMNLRLDAGRVNVICIGRGGADMHKALSLLFKAVNRGINSSDDRFRKLHIYFIGTSYAAAGKGQPTILPLAERYALREIVTEITDRMPFYAGLKLLQSGDILLVPGSDDPQYTASKIYPYIQCGKPMITILQESSSGVKIMRDCLPGEPVFTFPGTDEKIVDDIFHYLGFLLSHPHHKPELDLPAFAQFTAREMTHKQTIVFDQVISNERN